MLHSLNNLELKLKILLRPKLRKIFFQKFKFWTINKKKTIKNFEKGLVCKSKTKYFVCNSIKK